MGGDDQGCRRGWTVLNHRGHVLPNIAAVADSLGVRAVPAEHRGGAAFQAPRGWDALIAAFREHKLISREIKPLLPSMQFMPCLGLAGRCLPRQKAGSLFRPKPQEGIRFAGFPSAEGSPLRERFGSEQWPHRCLDRWQMERQHQMIEVRGSVENEEYRRR